jgi:hypothetical protein
MTMTISSGQFSFLGLIYFHQNMTAGDIAICPVGGNLGTVVNGANSVVNNLPPIHSILPILGFLSI